MDFEDKVKITIYSIIAILLIGIFMVGPQLRKEYKIWENEANYAVQKADDSTNYHTLKEIEDTCRAMIATYTSDKLMYEQYKDSEKTEEQNWAAAAKMRANRTASTYNQYILKNSYVFEGNVPKDVMEALSYLE